MYRGPLGLLTNRCLETPGDHNPDKTPLVISFPIFSATARAIIGPALLPLLRACTTGGWHSPHARGEPLIIVSSAEACATSGLLPCSHMCVAAGYHGKHERESDHQLRR